MRISPGKWKVLIWIRNFLLGQCISFLMSVTGVWTTYLVNDDASYSVLQSLTAYTAIFTVYMPLFLIFRARYKNKTFKNFTILKKPWKYAILGLVDLEGNYLVVLAYKYTDIMSVQLFSCFTTPCVLLLSVIILHYSFGITHLVGSALAIGGLVFLIVMDSSSDASGDGKRRVIGDLLCMGSSVLYATSNVLTEWFVKPVEEVSDRVPLTDEPLEERELEGEEPRGVFSIDATVQEQCHESVAERVGEEVESTEELPDVPPYIPIFEYLAMMSMFALCYSVIQFFAIEWKTFAPKRSSWTKDDWGYQILFGLTMLAVYTLMPTLFVICSACFANLSLLTSNVYGIFWNSVVFHVSPSLWFIVTLFFVTCGIILFNSTDLMDYPWLTKLDRPWKKREEELSEDEIAGGGKEESVNML